LKIILKECSTITAFWALVGDGSSADVACEDEEGRKWLPRRRKGVRKETGYEGEKTLVVRQRERRDGEGRRRDGKEQRKNEEDCALPAEASEP